MYTKWTINIVVVKSFLSLLSVPWASVLSQTPWQGQGFTYEYWRVMGNTREREMKEKPSTYLSLIYEVEASDAEQTKVVSTHSQTSPISSFSYSFILLINCSDGVALAVCFRPGSKHSGNKNKCLWDRNLLFHPAIGEERFFFFLFFLLLTLII